MSFKTVQAAKNYKFPKARKSRKWSKKHFDFDFFSILAIIEKMFFSLP